MRAAACRVETRDGRQILVAFVVPSGTDRSPALSDIRAMAVQATYVDGRRVAEKGRMLEEIKPAAPPPAGSTMKLPHLAVELGEPLLHRLPEPLLSGEEGHGQVGTRVDVEAGTRATDLVLVDRLAVIERCELVDEVQLQAARLSRPTRRIASSRSTGGSAQRNSSALPMRTKPFSPASELASMRMMFMCGLSLPRNSACLPVAESVS